jgi:hypothetical protein
MADRDQGRLAVAPLLTAPTQLLERPAQTRDLSWSSPLRFAAPRKRDKPDEWPLRSYLQLGALPGAVPCARLHAKLVLWEWGLDDLVETAELLVSEIITNAVRVSAAPESGAPGSGASGSGASGSGQDGGPWAGGLPAVWFWLAADQQNALIQVWDRSEDAPQRHETDPDAETGRGLLLVDRLSTRWGSYTPEGWSGKVVWAIVGQEHSLSG